MAKPIGKTQPAVDSSPPASTTASTSPSMLGVLQVEEHPLAAGEEFRSADAVCGAPPKLCFDGQ